MVRGNESDVVLVFTIARTMCVSVYTHVVHCLGLCHAPPHTSCLGSALHCVCRHWFSAQNMPANTFDLMGARSFWRAVYCLQLVRANVKR